MINLKNQTAPSEIETHGKCFVVMWGNFSELVSRREVYEKTSIYHPRTLANLDCQGKGPGERLKIGRTVYYPRTALVLWLASQVKSR